MLDTGYSMLGSHKAGSLVEGFDRVQPNVHRESSTGKAELTLQKIRLYCKKISAALNGDCRSLAIINQKLLPMSPVYSVTHLSGLYRRRLNTHRIFGITSADNNYSGGRTGRWNA